MECVSFLKDVDLRWTGVEGLGELTCVKVNVKVKVMLETPYSAVM